MEDDIEARFSKMFPDGLTLRDEANALVACAFRNGPLENLHAGQHSSLLDVPEYSRITDSEMKELMINASETLTRLLQKKEADPEAYDRWVKTYCLQYCQKWER